MPCEEAVTVWFMGSFHGTPQKHCRLICNASASHHLGEAVPGTATFVYITLSSFTTGEQNTMSALASPEESKIMTGDLVATHCP